MQLTFVNDLGQSTVIEIDPQMELENVMALLEAESGIPVAEQSIHFEGRDLSDPKSTMAAYGVRNHAMLLLRRKVSIAGTSVEQDAEMMRLQVLGNPELMQRLEQSQPALADAARNDPARFAQLLRDTQRQLFAADAAREQHAAQLNADPYDVEAQRRIEEAIRHQAVLENMEHALEYSPEAFGRVIMLYIEVKVNGHPVKAFVDSGAQQTILSPECAETCGLMRLLDSRFSGMARGVGTAKILGRIHSAPLQVADLHLNCSYTVMEGRDVDLLFGLDMLKAYQACIDLEKNCLRIRGREIPFLAEHELPDKAKVFELPADESAAAAGGAAQPSVGPSSGSSAPSSFPGAGSALGARPAAGAGPSQAAPAPRAAAPPAAAPSSHPEASIKTLIDLGTTREHAISLLDAAGGNVEMAASLLF